MDTLPTTTKLDILKSLEKTLSIPSKNYFVKNKTSVRIAYFKHTVKGFSIKYITLATPEEVAIFLKKHGVIANYKPLANGSVEMYRKKIVCHLIDGRKDGSFTQSSPEVIYTWDEISITTSDALHYAAYNEYETAGGKLGMIFSNIFRKKGNRAA